MIWLPRKWLDTEQLMFSCVNVTESSEKSGTYNIAAVPRVDVSYGHPFKLGNTRLSISLDTRLWRLIRQAHQLFVGYTGFSQKWCDIKLLPRLFFVQIWNWNSIRGLLEGKFLQS